MTRPQLVIEPRRLRNRLMSRSYHRWPDLGGPRRYLADARAIATRPHSDRAGRHPGPAAIGRRLTKKGSSRCRSRQTARLKSSRICHQVRRYRFAGGAGRDPVGTHHQFDRTLQDATPRTTIPGAACSSWCRSGVSCSIISRVRTNARYKYADRAARHSPLTCIRARQCRARFTDAECNELHPPLDPAARPAAGLRPRDPISRCRRHIWKARRPWQDRRMLMDDAFRSRASASRRLAHGVRPLPRNHERQSQCSISTELNSTGAGASSSSKPARSRARPTAPCSPPMAKPPCSPPSSPPRSRARASISSR